MSFRQLADQISEKFEVLYMYKKKSYAHSQNQKCNVNQSQESNSFFSPELMIENEDQNVKSIFQAFPDNSNESWYPLAWAVMVGNDIT